MTVPEKITAAIAEHYVLDECNLTLATLLTDLGGDSLDAVEICMAIEEELNVDLPEFDQCKTIGDIIDLAERMER